MRHAVRGAVLARRVTSPRPPPAACRDASHPATAACVPCWLSDTLRIAAPSAAIYNLMSAITENSDDRRQDHQTRACSALNARPLPPRMQGGVIPLRVTCLLDQ